MYGSTTSLGKPDADDAAASSLSLMLLLLLLNPCSQKPNVMNKCPQNTCYQWSATLGEKAYQCIVTRYYIRPRSAAVAKWLVSYCHH